MKILLLIPALNAGGAERVMVTLANEWSKTEDVTLMVFNDGHCFYALSEQVHVLPMNLMPEGTGISRALSIPSTEIRRFNKIYDEIKRGGYDFILSFTYTANTFACLASSLLKKETIIISERNDPYGYSKPVKMIVDNLYQKSTIIICQNKMVKNYFRRHKFKNKLIVLPNPVNFADIPDVRPKNIKKEIVTVGRLIEQKNQRLLIMAFSEIAEEFPEYTLKIYGEGPLEKDLRTLISNLDLEKRVFLMGTKKRVMYEVNNASVFVLPSNFEGFPNVLIEAMATGLPVISSDFKTGVARKLIKNDQNGYLFEVGNEDDLIKKLKLMLNRENEFIQMGEKNRKIAERYKDDVVAESWLRKITNG